MKSIAPPALPDPLNTDETRWQAVLAKDAQADGQFVFAVRTTGIYCRPSCPARLAKRTNVEFYDTPSRAEAAGYRACKRCRPEGVSLEHQHRNLVERACRDIQASESSLALGELAARAGMSPHHFQRMFKRVTGLTPKAYQQGIRAARMQQGLARSNSVTDAIYGAGFNAASRFYESAQATLGMPASAYRQGGAGQDIRYAVEPCVLGLILVAATSRGVCMIELDDSAEALLQRLHERFPRARLVSADEAFRGWLFATLKFIEHPQGMLDLPLDIQGTVFQQRVWKALQQIPPGQTFSYTEIAQRLGMPKAVRAVAGACAANPVALAIPCHRVLRADGNLSGYRWGVERKEELLRREAEAQAPREARGR